MAKLKYHIVKITSSGLGDAIKSALSGAVYASISKRTLVIDWRWSRYADGDRNLFDALFSIKNIPHAKIIPHSITDVAPISWKNRLNMSMHEAYSQDDWKEWQRENVIKKYSIDFKEIDHPATVTVSWDFDQTEKLLSHLPECESTDDLFKYAAQNFFSLDKQISERVHKLTARLPEQYLSVHIRDTIEFSENKGQVPRSAYFDLIQSEVGEPNTSFFLASDNIEVQSLLKSRYPKLEVQDKWFSNAGEALHMSDSCPDKTENAKQALVDILMLANGTTLICNPQSCFAKCAQYFSPHSNQSVIDASRKPLQIKNLKRLWLKIKKLTERKY